MVMKLIVLIQLNDDNNIILHGTVTLISKSQSMNQKLDIFYSNQPKSFG